MNLRNPFFRSHILFICGLLGFVLSGFVLFREFKIEYLIGFIASMSLLVGDYLIPNDQEIKNPLFSGLRKNHKYQLDTIAKKISIHNPEKISKSNLIKLIRTKRESHQHSWNKFKWYSLVFSIIALVVSINLFPALNKIPPSYSIAFYEFQNGRLKIVNLDSLKFEPTVEDIVMNTVKLPLRIALTNNEDEALKVVKVIISYPPELEIMSMANPKIDPKATSIIYEHDIETLEPADSYTPLKIIDTLVFPFKFNFIKALAFTKDTFPIGSLVIIDEALYRNKSFDLGIDIFCQDRPVIHGKIHLYIKPNVSAFMDFPESNRSEIIESDKQLFKNKIPNVVVIESWEKISKSNLTKIKYLKETSGNTVYQFIYVNDILKRVSVDKDNDHIIDYMLLNTDDDSEPNYRLNGDNKTLMLDFQATDLL